MSQEKEMQIIAANFETKDGAKNALKAIKKAKLERGDVAVLSKSADGKVKVSETEEWSVFAASFGGAAGGAILVGILGGIGLVTTVGAIVGGVIAGVVANKIDRGFPNDQLKEMAQALEPDHSMIVVLTEAASVTAVEQALAASDGQHISHPISAELINEVGQALVDAEKDAADTAAESDGVAA